jgi:hypothetical protein
MPEMASGRGRRGPGRAVARLERWARLGFWGALIGSWVVMVAYMWDALTTIPSAERLEETRMAVIPTPRTFAAAVIFSALELGVVLAALWPWRPDWYAARMAVAAMALITWFIITTPMGLSQMDWVHRRWLGFMILALAAGLVVHLVYRLVRRWVGPALE